MTTLWDVVEKRGFVEIIATGQWYYDWSEFRAWRAPSGHLYWFEDSGCSCTSYGDGFSSEADLGDGDRDALERAFRNWAASANKYYCPENVVIDALEKLRQLRLA